MYRHAMLCMVEEIALTALIAGIPFENVEMGVFRALRCPCQSGDSSRVKLRAVHGDRRMRGRRLDSVPVPLQWMSLSFLLCSNVK